ncbi:hypothetical protein [Shinella sp.]|uniref:hypothetical protein n=1 Tax=Shinella sp. TaxID=1870904 RepID=UPI0029B5989D|nr:hypothetical protein [Shinella sp.]MDX3977464.1 hypothetical protein [Shinella sp.]
MKKSHAPDGRNPAQIRGDIQAGLTGDKRPGFDPALAPLETDAEAAGTPLDPEMVETARRTQREGKRPDVSADEGSAMRPIFPANHPLQSKIPIVGIAFAFAGSVFFLGAILLALGWL